MAESLIESHPQRLQIDSMLLSQLPLRKIAESVTPPVTAMALSRYKRSSLGPRVTPKDPKPIIVSDLECNAVSPEHGTIPPQPSTLRALVDRLADRQERALDRAEVAVRTIDTPTGPRPIGDDLKVLAPLFRERLNSIRLLGELTGELTAPSAGANITINIVASAPAGGPAPAQPYDLEEITPETNQISDLEG